MSHRVWLIVWLIICLQAYTCEDQCKNPTWIPAINALEMAYTTVDFTKQNGPSGAGATYPSSLGGCVTGQSSLGLFGQINTGQGARCDAKHLKSASTDFVDIEHLPVGSIGAKCASLNYALKGADNTQPASKLCVKRT